MSSLLDLSDELLLNVFDQIDDQRDAARLAMCNRHLWSMGDVPMRRKFRRVRFASGRIGTRIPKLLVEVLKNPHLGNYVQHIELDCHYRHKFDRHLSRAGLDDADLSLLSNAIRDAAIVEAGDQSILAPTNPNVFDLVSQNSHVVLDIFAALMASMSPRLTSIACCDLGVYIPKAWYWEQNGEMRRRGESKSGPRSFFGRFLLNAAKTGKYLQNVREVRFLSDTSELSDPRFYEETDFYHGLNAIRRLPAIRSVQWDASTDSEQQMSVRPPPRSANYTQLAFRHSTIESSILNHVIRSAKSLTHLTLTLGGRCMSGGYFRPVYLTTLLDSLLLYRDTLEHLDLDIDDEFSPVDDHLSAQQLDDDDGEERAVEAQCREEFADEAQQFDPVQPSELPQRGLRNLYHLKYLALGYRTLFFWTQDSDTATVAGEKCHLVDKLPPMLQLLRLYGYGDPRDEARRGNETMEQMKHLIQNFIEQRHAKLLSLYTIEGIDSLIPNGHSVDDPDENSDLLWKREIEDWSEEEDTEIAKP